MNSSQDQEQNCDEVKDAQRNQEEVQVHVIPLHCALHQSEIWAQIIKSSDFDVIENKQNECHQ